MELLNYLDKEDFQFNYEFIKDGEIVEDAKNYEKIKNPYQKVT